MSAWIVYSKDGLTERCVLRSLEYGGTHMGERAVTATFDSSSEVAFEVFDYLEYRGEKFELESVPTVKKTSDFNYGYELRFVSLKYELERCEMRDLVPNDNGVVYPTPLTFTFTGDVRYLVERIQACLDDLYGKGVWNIVIADGVKSEEKNISIAQQNCWNALALVSTTYGLNFYVKGRTITIGGEQSLVGHTFEYGKGNGLYEIERAADTGTGIVTKLRAYGASRNLDYSYPKKPEWNDSVLPVSFALSPLRLMLPSFKTDGKTDFVLADEATIAKYGIREASMVYDDIYPTITGATYNGQAIDEIKAADEVDESKSTFTVYLHDLGFDLEEHLTTSDAQISMKTGTLQGYTFNISGIEKLSGGYKLTLGRNSLENSEESGAYVPSKNWNMAKGDKFVLLNILMPQAYIRDAENRLLARAKEYLAQYGKTNFSYNIGLHDKFLVEHPSVYGALVEGARLSVYDAELGISEDVTIQSITITENMEENILPQVKVTLNNEPSASTLDRIQGKLNEVAAETAANNFSSQSELMAQYRKKLDKPFFEKLFVAIDKNGNEIATNDVTTPVEYILAKYDFASVGGMTMYAEGGVLNIPSIYNGLPIDNETLYWEEVNGSRVLKAKGGEGGGGVADSVAWVNVYGKPSWITDTKPSYSYSEISGTPTLLSSFTNDLGFVDSSALSGYLPLSGGTVTGTLTIGWRLILGNGKAIQFTNNDNKELLFYPYSPYNGDLGYYNGSLWGKVWTSANDGEGSGLDADLLDGLEAGDIQRRSLSFYRAHNATSVNKTDLNHVLEGMVYNYSSFEGWVNAPKGMTYGQVLAIRNHIDDWLVGQIAWDVNHNSKTDATKNLYFRASDINGFTYSQWHTIAFTDSNVASATKLKTARTIWGQKFDGTTDISGDLTLKSSTTSGSTPKIIFQRGTTSDTYYDSYIYNTGGSLTFGISTSGANYDGIRVALNDLRPVTDNSYALGTTAYRYSNIHSVLGTFSSNVTIGGTLSVASDTTIATKLTLNGVPIYKSQDDVLYIDANLAVRGGITMYATDAIDVPSIIDALPIASASAKGIAAFNPNDFSVVDGYVSFIGSGGVDESVLADYAKKTDLSKYLPLSGGQMTGSIDYPLGYMGNIRDLASSCIFDYTDSLTAKGVIDNKRSLMGYAHNVTYDRWWNIISVRGDSNKYGMYICSSMTEYGGNLSWNRQEGYEGAWQGERVILDSVNWSQYIDTGSVGAFLPLGGGALGGTLGFNNLDGQGMGISLYAGTSFVQNYGVWFGVTGRWGTHYSMSGDWAMYFSMDGDKNRGWVFRHADGNIAASLTAHGMFTTNNILTIGGITMYSDIRKKTKLQDVELSLKQIADAPLIEHYYNSDEKRTTHVGSIAQYWAETIGNDWFCKLDSEGYYTMEIQNAALASAISIARELVKYESKTDRKIRLLKERVKELEDKIEKLENN